MAFNCLKTTEPLREDSLLFILQFPGVPGTHLKDLRRMKGCVELTLESPVSFEPRSPGLEIQRLNHWAIILYSQIRNIHNRFFRAETKE